MLDTINRKISGLCTLVMESSGYEQSFTHKYIHAVEIYRVDFPEGTRVLLTKFEQSDFEELEADIVEFLFDIIISERYKEWKNYKLIEENVRYLQDNFLRGK
jgi:Na+-transporting NADH:ubiquinone oxidoreductase subunit NqrF